MRILLVGGGGREHALAWRLHRDDPSLELLAAPGNPGIAELAECLPLSGTDIPGLVSHARERAVDLTVVGPEAPLALGLSDHLRDAGLPVFGPTRAAAEIESSKAFAKRLMASAGVSTARAEAHDTLAGARDALRRFGAPVVVKASGLASGKGVTVCPTTAEAEAAVEDLMASQRFGDAGRELLIEEFMEGEELSLFALCAGRDFTLLPPLQDHKRLQDNDIGPNTGGMGAYLPVHLTATGQTASNTDQTASLCEEAAEKIVAPTLRALADAGRPFTGLLYAGLMATPHGLRVVEFNCRFGDPETQALVPVLDGAPPLLDAFRAAAAAPGAPPLSTLRFPLAPPAACVTVVLAAHGYPHAPRTGDPIHLPPLPNGGTVTVFQAGTARDADGRLVTAGGRVLAVSATAPSVALAREQALRHAERIEFEGKQYRTDIGWREIARERGRGAGAA